MSGDDGGSKLRALGCLGSACPEGHTGRNETMPLGCCASLSPYLSERGGGEGTAIPYKGMDSIMALLALSAVLVMQTEDWTTHSNTGRSRLAQDQSSLAQD